MFRPWLVLATVSALGIHAQGRLAPTAAQINSERFPMGLSDPSPEELAKVPLVQLTRAYIPEAIDLGPSFPEPGTQVLESCTAWATGYAARSYYARAETGRPQDLDDIPSPAFIYNRIVRPQPDKPCGKVGTSILDALNLLQTTGAPSMKDFGNDQTCVLNHPVLQTTPGKFRIAGHELIGGRFTTMPLSLDKVRQRLAQGHPVVIGMRVDEAFTALRPGQVYVGPSGLSREQLRKMGGHAMVLVGYDDRRRAARVLNSWGKTWGDSGFGWIGYAALAEQVGVAHVMRTSQTPPRPSPSRPPEVATMPKELATELVEPLCSLVESSSYEVTVPGSEAKLKLQYSGFVSRASDKARFDAYNESGKGRADVQLRPWPLCEASLHLRVPLRASSRPTVTTISGNTTLKVGDTFGVRIKAPDTPMFLYAYYLEDDGTIVNLLPRRGPLREMTPAGAEILLGDGHVGRPTFRVTPLKTDTGRDVDERGHEAVIVIAARAPIDELEAEETGRSPRAQPGTMFRQPAEAAVAGVSPERIFLSKLKDLTSRRESEAMLQREATADLLHLRIVE
jgi:Papain family cysteine protease